MKGLKKSDHGGRAMSEGITASCLCGAVHLVLADRDYEAMACHCRECRKAQGALAAVNVPLNDEDILAFEGIDRLAEYESSAGKFRAFCLDCGSPIYSRLADKPGVFRIRSGLIDDGARITITQHIFFGDRAEWEVCEDSLPKHEGWPP
jgi:hypothetical protein